MDPYEDAPLAESIAQTHAVAASAPASEPLATLPPLTSGTESFDSIDAVLARVRQLHEVADPEVTPHKSKYAARIIMTDILGILKPLLSAPNVTDAQRQWLTEQIGRIEYLNGVNHIEAEETSAGEKMLQKAMLKFKDNGVKYSYDVIDGYNHLGIVWSNRTQHGVAHAYLQHAQQAFLRVKRLRKSALDQLPREERRRIEEEDRRKQMEEAVEGAEEGEAKKEERKSEEAKEERKEDGVALSDVDVTVAGSSSAAAAAASSSYSLSPSHPGYAFLPPAYWHSLELSHTMTLFFLAQVFGHLKKRDLAALYCHLTLNRQLRQRKDFQRNEWVTNAIGLSFYYSGRKLFQQAHHCLLAAQSFIKPEDIPRKMNSPNADTTRDQQLAADLCRAWGAFYLKWLQRSRDLYIESDAPLTPSNTLSAGDQAVLQAVALTSGSASSSATTAPSDDLGQIDPTSSLTSLPPAELAELRKQARLDREHERHFEAQVEVEADEEEDEVFGDLNKARKRRTDRGVEGGDEEAGKQQPPPDRTLPARLTEEESRAVREELQKNAEEEEQEQRERADLAAAEASAVAAINAAEATLAASPSTAAPDAAATASSSSSAAAASAAAADPQSTHVFIAFKSLHLPPSPVCLPATSFVGARALFKQSLEWFTRASYFYLLDGYVSDHIPIQQDLSLLYKLLAVFDPDLSRQCKMHKRRIDILTPIYSQLSIASYQEFYQQLTDEIASTYAEMVELKQLILQMKVRLLGPKKFPEKKRDDAQSKINELALHAIKFYQLWLQSWSKDGKEVETLDEYYHRWYLMAMFKIARCYSKIYHSDGVILNQFVKKSYDAYRAVISKALAWNAVHVMPEELTLCKEMVELLPHKMDRIVAKGAMRA